MKFRVAIVFVCTSMVRKRGVSFKYSMSFLVLESEMESTEEIRTFFVLWSSFLKKNSYFKLKLCLLLRKYESCHPSDRRETEMKTCYDDVFNHIVPSEQEQSPMLVFTNPDDLKRKTVAP